MNPFPFAHETLTQINLWARHAVPRLANDSMLASLRMLVSVPLGRGIFPLGAVMGIQSRFTACFIPKPLFE